jgi:hypothetical protein
MTYPAMTLGHHEAREQASDTSWNGGGTTDGSNVSVVRTAVISNESVL